MAEYKVELNRRLIAAFPSLGIYIPNLRYVGESGNPVSPRIVPNEKRKRPYEKDYEDAVLLPEGLPTDGEDRRASLLHTPLWDVVTVRTLGDEAIEYEFPNDPLVDVQLSKKITETQISGGASIVEIQGKNGADIRLRGVLWANDGVYPSAQLEAMLAVFEENAEVEVIESRFFGWLGIRTFVVVNLSLPAFEGFADSQPFVMTVRETTPVTLSVRA